MSSIELLTFEDIIEKSQAKQLKFSVVVLDIYPHFAFDKYPTPFEKAAML